jgi:hypothetical protein
MPYFGTGQKIRCKGTGMNLTDRRRSSDRRLTNRGPSLGVVERRVNMERRIFDFGLSSMTVGVSLASDQHTIVREGLRTIAPKAHETLV